MVWVKIYTYKPYNSLKQNIKMLQTKYIPTSHRGVTYIIQTGQYMLL